MAAEERERAEETSDKLREMLVQVSPKNFHAILLYLEGAVLIHISGASATYCS